MITIALRFSVMALVLASVMMPVAQAAAPCGQLVTVKTHGSSTTRYAFALPDPLPASSIKATVLLLPGGGGHLDLDDAGCPRALQGNSLVRKLPLFHAAGFATALVDAPSDHPGEDGLAGFRIRPAHAQDLGSIIADVRARSKTAVWVIGTSRGSISAVNVASAGISGAAAPDGIVLTSALMSGNPRASKDYVAHSVFDLPLGKITVPALIIGHADDSCERSPAGMMNRLAAALGSTRKQVVTVTGGPGKADVSGLDACVGRSPHGFVEQEDAVVSGIARFIAGGDYQPR